MSNKQEVIMCSVGDLMLSDSPLFVGVGVGSVFPKIKDEVFKKCEQYFHNADIVIGNLETVVYHPAHRNLAELQMSCPECTIEAVRKAGFTVLNLANNHCLQHGTDAFFYTKKVCEDAGIGTIGVRDEAPHVIDVQGIHFVFFSLCIHIEWYQPDDIRYEDDIEKVLKKVGEYHKANPRSIIVLSVHWGDEFASFPTNEQITLAHKFIDAGVDIILGHHSHVFQGIEQYKGSLCVYGHGNFVSDMVPQMCRETGIVQIRIYEDGCEKKISYEMLPYFINDRMIPEPCTGEWFQNRQREMENALNGKYTDKDYWNIVNAHHRSCSNDFRVRFKKTFYKYRLNVFIRMMYEFFVRKLKKKLGE